MVRIKDDPNLPLQSKVYEKGVESFFALLICLKNKGLLSIRYHEALEKILETHDYSHHEISELTIVELLSNIVINDNFIDALFDAHFKGEDALRLIV